MMISPVIGAIQIERHCGIDVLTTNDLIELNTAYDPHLPIGNRKESGMGGIHGKPNVI